MLASSTLAGGTMISSFNGRTAHCRCANVGSIPIEIANSTGCSLVWRKRVPRTHKIGGSNPLTLTKFTRRRQHWSAAPPYKRGAADCCRRQGSFPWTPTIRKGGSPCMPIERSFSMRTFVR